ncbi:unnamed protein product [Blepharisma stoltei]|uniref:Serine protease n=1 Tax=Blepharisma stoltei TaxID=1481888 RepID=A0AAU9J0E5_9CILI|nr:unnamed protein product [Blepharisma stoltei]
MNETSSLFTDSSASKSALKLNQGERSNLFAKLGASVITPHSSQNKSQNLKNDKGIRSSVVEDNKNEGIVLKDPTYGIEHIHGFRVANLGNNSLLKELDGYQDSQRQKYQKIDETPKPRGLASLRHPDPPNHAIETQVSIFSISDQDKLVKKPIGHAILLSGDLLITSNSIISSEQSEVFIRTFNNRPISIIKEKNFISNKNWNFTILSVANFSKDYEDIRTPFSLMQRSVVKMIDQDPWADMNVVNIDQKQFCFTSGRNEKFLPGSGVFTSNWELQGMYTHSISYLNFAVRFEPILAYLRLNRGPLYYPELENLIDPYINHIDHSKSSKHYQSYINSVQSLMKYFDPKTFINM